MIHEPAVLQDWLEDIICGTSTKTNALKEFESQQPRRNICTNLSKMVKVLQIQKDVSDYALMLMQRLSLKQVRINKNLIFKISTVCLILSQKIAADQNSSLEAFSLVSGITMKELAQLEMQVLELLNYHLIINEKEFIGFRRKYEKDEENMRDN